LGAFLSAAVLAAAANAAVTYSFGVVSDEARASTL
jgi:hypothetical protein